MHGDEQLPLARLWEKSRNMVFARLLAGVADFHKAEDLLQDVAVSAAENFHKYDYERPFTAWVLGIARNHVLMYYRKNKLDRLVFSEHILEQITSVFATASPSDGRREALRICLQRLDTEQRRIIDMRYGAGLSVAELAAQLGRTSAALKTALHRIRTKLEWCIRRRMAQEGLPQ